MGKAKTVRVRCHGSIAFGEEYNAPWEDVWLEWKGGGKRRYSLSPCILGTAHTKENIEFIHKLIEETIQKDKKDEQGNPLFSEGDEEHVHDHAALTAFENGERFYVWANTHDNCERKRKARGEISGGCPAVYINMELFHKSHAEEACRVAIEHVFPEWKGKTKNWKFQWKLPKYIINPL
jgi:hypothetical protein